MPSAHRYPAEEHGEQGKGDGADKGAPAARANASEERGYDEQSNGVEDEEGRNESGDERDNATQRGLLESVAIDRKCSASRNSRQLL